MVIWRICSSIEYLSLDYANDSEIKNPEDYFSGKVPEWNPIHVTYMTWVSDDTDERHERVPNFPHLSTYIVCDESAKAVLKHLVHDHVEFLPLQSQTIVDRKYCLLWTKTILGHQVTDGTSNSRACDGIELLFRHKSFVLYPSYFDYVPIFRLPGTSKIDVFVTDEFKQLVEDSNLTGLVFEKLWEI